MALKKGRREGERKGLEKGLLEGIVFTLKTKFGEEGKRLVPKARALHDIRKLRALSRALTSAESIEDVKRLIP
jgi:hypothetical protein